MDISDRRVVHHTPFFDLIAKSLVGQEQALPFYSLAISDYVCIVPIDRDGNLILVRQYRPAVEQFTLEIPAGCLESGESHRDCAIRELWEETGYRSERVEFLGSLLPDTGRLGNKMWCHLATDATHDPNWPGEAGVETVIASPAQFREWILNGTFNHALHVAAVMLAQSRGAFRSS